MGHPPGAPEAPLIRLKEARARRGLSQRDLARLAGVAEPTVHRVERVESRPRTHVARRLAQALNLDPTEVTELRAALTPQPTRRRIPTTPPRRQY